MELKEFATMLNGREYGCPQFTQEELRIAKDNGFVIVSGASDDLVELDANGCFENVEAAAAAIVRKKDTTMPSPQLVEKYEKGYAKFKQFYPALKGKY